MQARVQERYGSPIPAGLYVAFRIALYEFPQQWFHQCMLNILLGSLTRRASIPDTMQLVTGGSLFLDLWSSVRLSDLCSSGGRGLLRLACLQLHPRYTFAEATAAAPAGVVSRVRLLDA